MHHTWGVGILGSRGAEGDEAPPLEIRLVTWGGVIDIKILVSSQSSFQCIRRCSDFRNTLLRIKVLYGRNYIYLVNVSHFSCFLMLSNLYCINFNNSLFTHVYGSILSGNKISFNLAVPPALLTPVSPECLHSTGWRPTWR